MQRRFTTRRFELCRLFACRPSRLLLTTTPTKFHQKKMTLHPQLLVPYDSRFSTETNYTHRCKARSSVLRLLEFLPAFKFTVHGTAHRAIRAAPIALNLRVIQSRKFLSLPLACCRVIFLACLSWTHLQEHSHLNNLNYRLFSVTSLRCRCWKQNQSPNCHTQSRRLFFAK